MQRAQDLFSPFLLGCKSCPRNRYLSFWWKFIELKVRQSVRPLTFPVESKLFSAPYELIASRRTMSHTRLCLNITSVVSFNRSLVSSRKSLSSSNETALILPPSDSRHCCCCVLSALAQTCAMLDNGQPFPNGIGWRINSAKPSCVPQQVQCLESLTTRSGRMGACSPARVSPTDVELLQRRRPRRPAAVISGRDFRILTPSLWIPTRTAPLLAPCRIPCRLDFLAVDGWHTKLIPAGFVLICYSS